MNLEDQVTSLELSKKLKELGVNQDSLFYWVDGALMSNEKFLNMSPMEVLINFSYDTEGYSAFTVAELCELLPSEIIVGNIKHGLYLEKVCDKFYICYSTMVIDGDNYRSKEYSELIDFNLCHVLAKMLIYLIENKLI